MKVETGKPQRITLVQGEYRVVNDPNIVLVTILGSCVAACLRDPIAGVGGMNHFLLPADEVGHYSSSAERMAVHLMELLVNEMMRRGAHRERLEAKIFGGARMLRGLSDIGKKNSEFATRFLAHEGISIVSRDLGGFRGRRLEYWPVTGRARQIYMSDVVAIPERNVDWPSSQDNANTIELFSQ